MFDVPSSVRDSVHCAKRCNKNNSYTCKDRIVTNSNEIMFSRACTTRMKGYISRANVNELWLNKPMMFLILYVGWEDNGNVSMPAGGLLTGPIEV